MLSLFLNNITSEAFLLREARSRAPTGRPPLETLEDKAVLSSAFGDLLFLGLPQVSGCPPNRVKSDRHLYPPAVPTGVPGEQEYGGFLTKCVHELLVEGGLLDKPAEMLRLFNFNKRVLLFVCAMLVALDLFIGFYIDWRFAEPACCRLPCDDAAAVQLWIRQVEKAEGFKIVFLGDSAVHGLAAGSGADSLPAAVSRCLKKRLPQKEIKVFNLALEGCGPAETFLLFNALSGARVDLVIYDLNIAWFSRRKTLDHPNLLALTDNYPHDFNPAEIAPDILTTKEQVRGEARVKESLSKHWKLYHYRILLNYWLFGKPIRNELPLAMQNPKVLLTNSDNVYAEIKELRTPWREKDWPADARRGRLGEFNISGANRQWKFYLRFIELLKEKGTRAVFYTPPRNFELLDNTKSINYPLYLRNSKLAVDAAGRRGIPVLKYDRSVKSEHFTDIIHTTARGNEMLADKMADDLISKGLLD